MGILESLIVLPLACALISAVVGSRYPRLPRYIAGLGIAGFAALVVACAMPILDGDVVGGIIRGVSVDIPALRADGLSLPMLGLNVFIGALAICASWDEVRRPGMHFALIMFLIGAVNAVFLADEIIFFYVAWESVLIPMYLLISGWGSSDAKRAAQKFLIYTFAGGAVLLVGVAVMVADFGVVSAQQALSSGSQGPGVIVFLLLAVGMLVKVPMVPLHTWLPDAHTEAPTAGSIILAGVLLKMGGYGLIRFALPMAPAGFASFQPVLIALGVVGVFWGSGCALVQDDLKRLVAYSSVAHMGFVLIGIGIATPLSIAGAVVVMVSHGVVAGSLFYLVGGLYERTHTRSMARLTALGTVIPAWSAFFVFCGLASAGLPALSGFPGEFAVLIESYDSLGWWSIVPASGVLLSAAYNLRAIRIVVHGPTPGFERLNDLAVKDWIALLAAGSLIVLIGVFPSLVTATVNGPVEKILAVIAVGVGS